MIPRIHNSAGSWIMVTVTAVLIWLWANAATRENGSENGAVRFALPADAVSSAVIVAGDALPNVSVSMRGPRVPLQAALDRVRNGVSIVLAPGSLPSSGQTEPVDVALAPAIESALQEAGFPVTVEKAEPASARVQIAPLVTETLPIQARISGAEIENQPEIDPPQARVSMPLPLRQTVGRIRVEAVVEPSSLVGFDTGRRYTLAPVLRVFTPNGPLSPERTPGLRIEPAVASVTFTLATRTTTATLAEEGTNALGIPVQVALPARETSQFEVEIAEKDAFLRNVTVAGDIDAIREITSGRFKVLAFVQLTSDDLDRAILEGGEVVKPVTLWALPPGVTVSDPGLTDYQIERERNPEQPARDGILVRVRRVPEPATGEG